MNAPYRITVYALVTAIVEGIFIWGLFTYAEADRLTIWFILAENFGMLLSSLIKDLPLLGSLH